MSLPIFQGDCLEVMRGMESDSVDLTLTSPPYGNQRTVLDPFCGSGTTLAVAEKLDRRWIGIDARQSQVDLSARRIAEVCQ